MSEITETRERLASAVSELPGDTTVALGPTNLDEPKTGTTFIIEKRVGENTEENQKVIDDLYDQVPEALSLDPVFTNTLFVSRCSGHRLYGTYPGAPVELGCEWTVRVLI